MKKLYFLLLCIVTGLVAQAQNCSFTYQPPAPGTSLYVFIPNSTFSPSQYYAQWNVNGTVIPGTLNSPVSVNFTTNGAVQVCMQVFDSLNPALPVCVYCDTIMVNGGGGVGNCNFIANEDSLTNGLFYFSATGVLPGNNIAWDFGDGSLVSYGIFSNHQYTAPGTYNVCATQFDPMTQTTYCTQCTTVVVSSSTTCQASFTWNSGPQVLFVNSQVTGGPVTSYQWTFGDGFTATTANAAHTYASPGTYGVCLIIQTASGCSDTTCQTITIPPASNCSFTWVPDSSSANTFQFYSSSTSILSQFVWDFGDSTTGFGPVISHQFPGPGVYLVCLDEIELATGNVLCTYCQQVTVSSTGNCSFTAQNTPANPNVFVFTPNPLLPNYTYIWDFGNGNVGSGGIVTEIYNAPGIYNVCLTVTGNGTTCTYCMNIVVPNTSAGCQAYFQQVSVGLNAYFINQSVLSANPGTTTYAWDFGNGNTSSLQYPNHQYSFPGTYIVCLTVNSSGCVSTYCDSVIIDTTVVNPGGCNAYFLFTQLAPYQMVAVNLSNGNNLSFSWNFGDGSPLATGAYPTHQYASTGNYLVCLTVSDPQGCTDTYCDSLSVDSVGNIVYRGLTAAGFTLNVLAPNQLSTAGVEDAQAIITRLYPVPARDFIRLELSQPSKNIRYAIHSTDGRAVQTGALTQPVIDIAGLSQGIYLLQLITPEGNTSTHRFIKE